MPTQARKAAVRCLLRVEEGAWSNLVLSRELAAIEDPREAAFCTALVTGTLSRLLPIDHLLRPFLKKDLSALDPEVRAILRMGVWQLYWADSVPARAAVNESAELCRAFRKGSAAGLVNAVLRKLADRPLPEFDDPSVRYSVCPGLLEALQRDFPQGWENILRGMEKPSPVFLRVNKLRWTDEQALEALERAGTEAVPAGIPGCLEVREGFRNCLSLIRKGDVRPQSRAAQFAAGALGARPGERVLDMCAAPGGKTMCIAQDMEDRGSLTALDVYGGRLRLVRELAQREGVSILETAEADASAYRSGEPFDRILCDVPCSGYGEICSKPELRYKDPRESAGLPELQLAILENAASLLKKGGTLVYSTCTVLKKENEEVVSRFLERHGEFRRSPMEGIPGGGDFLLLPGEESAEGFYAAKLTKTGE